MKVMHVCKCTVWCSEVGSLTSLDATELHASVTSENQFHCTRLYHSMWYRPCCSEIYSVQKFVNAKVTKFLHVPKYLQLQQQAVTERPVEIRSRCSQALTRSLLVHAWQFWFRRYFLVVSVDRLKQQKSIGPQTFCKITVLVSTNRCLCLFFIEY